MDTDAEVDLDANADDGDTVAETVAVFPTEVLAFDDVLFDFFSSSLFATTAGSKEVSKEEVSKEEVSKEVSLQEVIDDARDDCDALVVFLVSTISLLERNRCLKEPLHSISLPPIIAVSWPQFPGKKEKRSL